MYTITLWSDAAEPVHEEESWLVRVVHLLESHEFLLQNWIERHQLAKCDANAPDIQSRLDRDGIDGAVHVEAGQFRRNRRLIEQKLD